MKTVEEYNTVDNSLLWPAVQVRTLNMSITRFNFFWLTNQGKCIQLLALEIQGEKVVAEEEGQHVASKRRDMSQCLFVRSPTRPFLQSYFILGHSNPPQEVCLLQAWGCWNQTKVLPCAVWFSQLVWTFKKVNSAYWGRQNSSFSK
jgi:hypothetical protein